MHTYGGPAHRRSSISEALRGPDEAAHQITAFLVRQALLQCQRVPDRERKRMAYRRLCGIAPRGRDLTAVQENVSLVEHTMSSRALAAPIHRHLNEDEYSFVLEGQVGALLGDEVVTAGPGTLIFKPRNQWHTFWNAGDAPAMILEIISPAGFEQFFAQVVDLGGIMKADPQRLGELSAQYGLEMDLSSVPSLVERFGLRFPGEQVAAS